MFDLKKYQLNIKIQNPVWNGRRTQTRNFTWNRLTISNTLIFSCTNILTSTTLWPLVLLHVCTETTINTFVHVCVCWFVCVYMCELVCLGVSLCVFVCVFSCVTHTHTHSQRHKHTPMTTSWYAYHKYTQVPVPFERLNFLNEKNKFRPQKLNKW